MGKMIFGDKKESEIEDVVPSMRTDSTEESSKVIVSNTVQLSDIKDLEAYVNVKYEEIEDSITYSRDMYSLVLERNKNLSEHTDHRFDHIEKTTDKHNKRFYKILKAFDEDLLKMEKSIMHMKVAVGISILISLVSLVV